MVINYSSVITLEQHNFCVNVVLTSTILVPSNKRNSTVKAMGFILHCLTLLRHETCLFANCSSSSTCIMVL